MNDRQNTSCRTRWVRWTLTCSVVLSLWACASPQAIESRATMRDAASLGLSAQSFDAVAQDALWWRELGDAQLDRLVGQALASNPSLKLVQARMARAQASSVVMEGAVGPQLGVGFDATRQLFTTNGMVPAPLAGKVYETGSAQFTGSWELDFFGKNRAALDATLGSVRAAQADAEAARTLLASQVVRSYIQWLRLSDQLAVAQRLLAQREQVLRLVQQRVNAGLDTRLELRQSEGALPDARLQIETLQEQLVLSRHAMAALLGQANVPLTLEPRALTAIKNIAFGTTLPSDLLGRRADIAAARWRVEAALQEVNSARAQFYPNINLVAFAGFSSIGLDRLLGAGSEQWGAGPALRLPLFDGGRLRANLAGRAADLDAAIESYNAAVIESVREVADLLASTQAIERQQVEQKSAQAFAQSAYDLALQRYEAGLGTFLQVLTSETAVLAQRRQAVDLAARALDTQVSLVRALGGGYRAEPALAAAHPKTFSNPNSTHHD